MPFNKRKVAFSGKRKKKQLLLKRQSQKDKYNSANSPSEYDENSCIDSDQKNYPVVTQHINQQPIRANANRDVNRYNLQFQQESKTELLEMKKAAHRPLKITMTATHYKFPVTEIDDFFFLGYDFPIRPKWHKEMTKQELISSENYYFKEYINKTIQRSAKNNIPTSVFELNLETWRQFWRVIEMSDILLLVTDARYPSLMFSPELFFYLKNTLNKNVILILNKIDLISAEAVVAWRYYFTEKYEGIHVVPFTTWNPKQTKDENYKNLNRTSNLLNIKNIFTICRQIVNESNIDLNLTAWENKIMEDYALNDEQIEINNICSDENEITCTFDESIMKFKKGILTIGFIGFPNSGKSSVINSLKGRKVVSVSKTPGHTKHFQTIFLTENVKLCDSPGLVFPSRIPKYLQVLIGSFPIAQVKEPYQSLVYAGERLDLPTILGINLPPDYDEWSAFAICEAWCYKRGFLTAKASRPDYYRAANNILRMILDGKIVLKTFPPGFAARQQDWMKHSEVCALNLSSCNRQTLDILHNTSIDNSLTNISSESVRIEKNDYNQLPTKQKMIGNIFDILESE